MSELVTYFSTKEKVEIHLILFGRSRGQFFSVPQNVKIHKPTFRYQNGRRLIFTIKTIFYLRSTIKKLNPDTILSFGEEWNNLVLLSVKGLKVPVYVSDRAEPGKKRRGIQEFLRNILYKDAKAIVVQTKKAGEIYRKKFPDNRIEIIGNPFQLPKEVEYPKGEKIILSVGRLIDSKHYDLLIRYFSEVKNERWKLVIAGGNSVKQHGMSRLKNLVDELQLNEKVELPGMVANVEEWYKRSSIFAFTSSSEGFPNVIGEAMQHGLPVIAFDCIAGPSDLIEHKKNGFLIPLFDGETYVQKLEKLIDDSELRETMGRESENKIREFSIDRIGEKYFKLITSEV